MTELQAIVQAYASWQRDRQPAILATVVRIKGSSYRRPGARMLLLPDGRSVGTVSGGCLEGDVKLRAWRLTASGCPAVVRYDSTSDGEIVWQLGLGCKGVVDVLLERLDPGQPVPHLEFLRDCLHHRRLGLLARVVSADGAVGVAVGDYLTADEEGVAVHSFTDDDMVQWIAGDAAATLKALRSRNIVYQLPTGQVEVFLEVVEPPRALLLCGAGHDAIPLVRLAKEMGNHVTVLDPRPTYATRDRFPGADDVIVAAPEDLLDSDNRRSLRTVSSGEKFAARLNLTSRGAAVILSHNYHNDLGFLRSLLPSPVGYLGVLGPRDRTERLLGDLADVGCKPARWQLDRLFGPIGLNLGADTPEQIALAVLAEIEAFFAGRRGGFLRDEDGPIHDRSADPLRFAAVTYYGVRSCATGAL